jgi:hypothetical protein
MSRAKQVPSKSPAAPAAEKKPTRCFVEVDPDTGEAFDEIFAAVGNPKKITLATAALRHIVKRVKAGELELVNNELRPAQAA